MKKNIKKIAISLAMLASMFSCSSDGEELDGKLSVCFEIDKNIVKVNEPIQITNCSKNANSYVYEYGFGKTTNEVNPVISFETEGEKRITLTVTNNKGEFLKKTVTVTVKNIVDSYLEVPRINKSDKSSPIAIGVYNEELFFVERLNSTLNLVNYDANTNTFNKKYLGESTYRTSNGHIVFLSNSKKNLFFLSTMSSIYGSKDIYYDENWNHLDGGAHLGHKTHYGFINRTSDILYFGSYQVDRVHKPAVELRNQLGELVERKIYSEIEQGFIGAMLKTDNGYLAFGGKMDISTSNHFDNYRAFIMFFDNDLNLINKKEFEIENPNLVKDFNHLGGVFNLKKLSNGNYVTYSHNVIRIISASGEVLKKIKFSDNGIFIPNTNGLYVTEDSFIISSNNYLRKYSNEGIELKSFEFKGLSLPEFVEFNNKIYFTTNIEVYENSEYQYKLFLGAINNDLELVDLK